MIKMIIAAIMFLLIPGQQDAVRQQAIRVTYVVTDLVVRDAAGNFVSGLKPEDLRLSIDGKETPIRSLDEFSLLTRDSVSVQRYLEELNLSREKSEAPPIPPSQPRLFLLVFDTGSLGPISFAECKKTARVVVEEMVLPYDSVVFLSYHDSFSVLSGPTTNAGKALAEFEALPPPGGLGKSVINTSDIALNPESATDSADAVAGRARAALATRRYVQSFEGLARSIRSFPGKKSIIMFSDGPNVTDLQRFLNFGVSKAPANANVAAEFSQMEHVRASAEFDRSLKEMAQALNSSSISVYSVRRGLKEPEWVQLTATELQNGKGMPDSVSIYGIVKSMETERIGTMQVMAENTHGAFYDAALPVETLVANLQERTGVYYLLGFSAPADKSGGFHTLDVSASNPELQVTHREGFFGEKSFDAMTPAERAINLEEGFYMVPQPDDLGIEVNTRVLPVVGAPPRALISVSIDPRRLGRNDLDTRSLECVVNIEGGGKKLLQRRHWLRTAPDGQAATGLKWFNLEAPLRADGPSTIHVALRDDASMSRSARSSVLEAPSPNGNGVRAAILLCSPDPAGDISTWPLEKQEDEKGDPGEAPIPFNYRVLGDGGLRQGGDVVAIVLFGGIAPEQILNDAEPQVLALLDPNTVDQAELPTADNAWKYDAARRLLWVKTRIPLGTATKPGGRIGIVVQGLTSGRPLATATAYAIVR